jgi:hypothetical protein
MKEPFVSNALGNSGNMSAFQRWQAFQRFLFRRRAIESSWKVSSFLLKCRTTNDGFAARLRTKRCYRGSQVEAPPGLRAGQLRTQI